MTSPPGVVARFGATDETPVVILLEGQSNAVGQGDGQDTAVDQSGGGIWIYSNLEGGADGTMVQAAYGVAPLNRTMAGTVSTVASECHANISVHAANEMRALGVVAPETPIWIGVVAAGGINISEWVDGSKPRQVAREAMLDRMTFLLGTPVTVFAMHWQQGEANSASTGNYNTDETYIAAFGAFMADLRASAHWTRGSTLTIGEILTARPFLSGGVVWRPANARNATFRQIASSGRFPDVALISTSDLVQQGTEPSNVNHYSGLALQSIGARWARHMRAMRAGGIVSAHATATGNAVVAHPLISLTSETCYLGHADVATGHLFLKASAAEIHLPAIAGFGVRILLNVWTNSSGNTIVHAPASWLFGTPGGLITSACNTTTASVSLEQGQYEIWFCDRWFIRDLLPQRGNHCARVIDLYHLVGAGGTWGFAFEEARDTFASAYGNLIGLPPPEGGGRFTILCRGTYPGATIIGRAANSVTIADAGTGYAPGDEIILALGGASGAAPVLRVRVVSGTGGIVSVAFVNRGAITTATTIPAGIGQVSTTGAGTGATFNIGYSSGTITTHNGAATDYTYSLDQVGQIVQFIAAGASWRVVTDSKL